MWTTVEEVKSVTGSDVSLELIGQAQSIIESYVGRFETEVTNATDQMLLGRATAYQAAYMSTDEGPNVFEQMNVLQTMGFGNMITFKQNDAVSPFVAPLAVIACQRLSWKRIRSVKTGSIFSQPVEPWEWSKD